MINAYTTQLTTCEAQIEEFLATMESRSGAFDGTQGEATQ
jgi:hypothetical protein